MANKIRIKRVGNWWTLVDCPVATDWDFLDAMSFCERLNATSHAELVKSLENKESNNV